MIKCCEQCGRSLVWERRICTECRRLNKREYAKRRYAERKAKGLVNKRYGITLCAVCGKEIIRNRPTQFLCFACYKRTKHKTVNDYNLVRRSSRGNMVSRQMFIDLGIILPRNMVIHHIDENPNNNSFANFLLLSRSLHAKLHRFLEREWSLLLKSNSSNLEDCWDILRDRLTTTWLETTSVNVIKIADIGQSAAESLNEDVVYMFSQEKGSETMYQASKSSDTHDEDIVQTQNIE